MSKRLAWSSYLLNVVDEVVGPKELRVVQVAEGQLIRALVKLIRLRDRLVKTFYLNFSDGKVLHIISKQRVIP